MKKILLATLALASLLAALPASAQKLAGCENGACSASGLSTQALSDIAKADKPINAPASAQRDELRSPARAADPWNRHMPVRPDLESYDCIMSFGVGGELSKNGFFGTRVLGRTQQWSSPASTSVAPR